MTRKRWKTGVYLRSNGSTESDGKQNTPHFTHFLFFRPVNVYRKGRAGQQIALSAIVFDLMTGLPNLGRLLKRFITTISPSREKLYEARELL
ncbi:hypothetical protein SUGI_0501620 [Cryptomeria japonica]|nr:hypothetical protein SUGI_0501620 [Cryptomeria japonica]